MKWLTEKIWSLPSARPWFLVRSKSEIGCAVVLLFGTALAAIGQTETNPYSLNVVGYVNLALPEGPSLVANQLDYDGTGTNNTLQTVFGSSLPENSQVSTWNGSSFDVSTFRRIRGATNNHWTARLSLNPGSGFWVSIPRGAGAQTVTTVGIVLQGRLTNHFIVPDGGFSLLACMIPMAGSLESKLGYIPAINDQVFLYNGADYTLYTYTIPPGSAQPTWFPSEPYLDVAQAFWLKTRPGQSWTLTFTVQAAVKRWDKPTIEYVRALGKSRALKRGAPAAEFFLLQEPASKTAPHAQKHAL